MLSCLCNNNTIIVFTQCPTPILPLAYCSFNQSLVHPPPPLLWPWPHAMWFDSKLERSYRSLINKTQLSAQLVFQNQWGQEHLKMDFSLRTQRAPWKMCSIFPPPLAQFDMGVWVCACAGWRMCVEISVHVRQEKRKRKKKRRGLSLWLCDYVRVSARTCVSAVGSESGKHHCSPPPFDDVCGQRWLCPEMVSDSREYACNEVETEGKWYVQTL